MFVTLPRCTGVRLTDRNVGETHDTRGVALGARIGTRHLALVGS